MQALISILDIIIDSETDNAARKAAEASLEELRKSCEFCERLSGVALNPNINFQVRQLATIVLKREVTERWHLMPPDVRCGVQNAAQQLLFDADCNVSRAAAVIIVKMAAKTYPAEWPSFPEELYEVVSRNAHALPTMTFLLYSLTEEMTAQQLTGLLPFVPFLLEIAFSSHTDEAVATEALRAANTMLLIVGVDKEEVQPLFSNFFSTVVEACLRLTPSPIQVEALRFVRQGIQGVPSLCTVELVASLTNSLHNGYEEYSRSCLHSDEDVMNSQGVVSKVAAKRLDFILFVMSKKGFAKVYREAFEHCSEDLCGLLLSYCTLSMEQIQNLADSPNDFLRQEEDRVEQLSWSARDVAADTLQTAVKALGKQFVHIFMSQCNALLATPLSEGTWKSREAALFAVSHTMCRRMKVLVDCGIRDFVSLASLLISTDLATAGTPPLLMARALLVLRDIMTKTTKNVVSEQDLAKLSSSLLPPIAQTVANPANNSILVVAAACQLLSPVVARIDADMVESYAEVCVGALCFLAKQPDIQEETLYLCLDTTRRWLKQCPAMPFLVRVPPALVESWHAHLSDPNMGEIVIDVFAVMLQHPETYEQGFIEILPWISEVLQGRENMAAVCSTPFVIKLLSLLLKRASDVVLHSLRLLIGSLCQLLLTNEDSSITAEACHCLAALLGRIRGQAAATFISVSPSSLNLSPDKLLPLDEEPVEIPLPKVLFAIALMMLGDSRDELTLLNIGSFLCSIVEELGQHLASEEMAELLAAICHRVNNVRSDSAVEELLLPVAYLIVHHFSAVFSSDFIPFPMLFAKWLPRHSSFLGRKIVQLTSEALLCILENFPPILEPISVQMPLPKNRGVVDTPLKLAIFVALGNTLAHVLSNREDYEDESDEDDVAEINQIVEEMQVEEDEDTNESDKGENDEGDDEYVTPSSVLTTLTRIAPFVQVHGGPSLPYFAPRTVKKLQEFCSQL